MSNRWPTKQYPRQPSLRGVATVKVIKSVVKVAFETAPEDIIEIPVTQAPGVIKNGKWMVSMSAKRDRLFSLSPITGMFETKFREFAHAQGQIPSPVHRQSTFTNQDGSAWVVDYDAFTALLEITTGPCAGMTVGHFLRYNFSEINGEVAFTKPKSKYTKQLGDFLDAAGGFDKGPMKYSENILPALQSRLQTANYTLAVILKDGNIDSLTRVGMAEMEESEEEEEEKKPAPSKFKSKKPDLKEMANDAEPDVTV